MENNPRNTGIRNTNSDAVLRELSSGVRPENRADFLSHASSAAFPCGRAVEW
jgi:hypothetical protein